MSLHWRTFSATLIARYAYAKREALGDFERIAGLLRAFAGQLYRYLPPDLDNLVNRKPKEIGPLRGIAFHRREDGFFPTPRALASSRDTTVSRPT